MGQHLNRTHIAAAAALMALALLSSQPGAAVKPDDQRLRGLVRPSKYVEITPPTDGIITQINVKEMQAVKKDEVLAQMDDELQASITASARHELERQKLVLAEAENEFEAIQQVVKDGAGSDVELRRRKAQRDAQKLQVDRSAEDLNLQEARLARYKIRAPFNGEVIQVVTVEGARLAPSDKALVLISRDPLEAHMHLPVELMDQLSVGTQYTFAGEAPVNKRIHGMLTGIEPRIDNASGTFRAVFKIANPDLKLPAGFTVKLLWPQGTESASTQ